MAPRKPPPLDKSLFVGNGPLAPGSAPLPPSPFKVHPAYVIDGHSFPDRPTTDSTPIFGGLPESYPRPPVRSAIQVKTNVSAEPAPAILGVKPFSIHPTILNLTLATPPSITNIAKGAVDIIVPCTYPLTEKEWDLLDEAVKALDGTWGREAKEAEGQTDPDPSAPARSPVGRGGKIVISGLFPPPLTKQSEALLTDKAFNLHVTRLSQLSFHANVYLKALPPVVDANALPGQSWWTDRKEVERVLKVYAMPSIETFGTHRLIYGSSPALPLADLAHATGADTDLQQPISSEEWYGVIRRVVTEIGEGASAITDFMGGNAANVYGLQV